jgi:hypothetical protein
MKTNLVMWPGSVLLVAGLVGCSTANTPSNPNGATVQPPAVPGGMNNPGTAAGTGGVTAGPAPTGGGGGTSPVVTPVAGTGALAAGNGAGGAPSPAADAGTEMPGNPEDPRGKCNINSGYPGDEACLLPPAAGQGMQIHVGPTSYEGAAVNAFVFTPGSEESLCWSFHTPNTEAIWYQGWELSGRPGTHHIINSMYATEHADGTTFTACRDPGIGAAPDLLDNLPGASKAYMPRAPIAPENANLGRMIPPRAPAQADMHYFNFTQENILREFWLNIYFVSADQVEEQANQIRAMGGIGWQISPGTDHVYQYSAPINAAGRITQLLGHYHAHGKRFTSWLRKASGERIKVFEMYDYQDPQIFYYDSITTNPTFSDTAAGASSGILTVAAGDTIQWECHIINDSQQTLTYTNEVNTGEMCNLWGSSVGPVINSVLLFETPF